jgi:hypothetical protein
MRSNKFLLPFVFLIFCGASSNVGANQEIPLSSDVIEWIAQKVSGNECHNLKECLLHWNRGENFLSLGIGHFIWYPKEEKQTFEESFNKFLVYLKKMGKPLPAWLDTSEPPCPWNNREEFLSDIEGARAMSLRDFLIETRSDQVAFLILRLHEALPKMLDNAPQDSRLHIKKQFYRVAVTRAGKYALVDYINFKGLGVSPTERYQGKGWGLLQILSQMSGEDDGRAALEEFSKIAHQLLEERVKNSPAERNEAAWLPGWQNRVNTYLQALEELEDKSE